RNVSHETLAAADPPALQRYPDRLRKTDLLNRTSDHRDFAAHAHRLRFRLCAGGCVKCWLRSAGCPRIAPLNPGMLRHDRLTRQYSNIESRPAQRQARSADYLPPESSREDQLQRVQKRDQNEAARRRRLASG